MARHARKCTDCQIRRNRCFCRFLTLPVLVDLIIRFHQMTDRGRAPIRAERSACGRLPVRAVRYCEALTSATAFGWWLFSPIDIEMLWDGSEIFWRCDDAPDWMPLLPSAQLPNYAAEFDAFVPEALKGCSPPFLTALPEPGTVQLWTGLIAQTAPEWHLLIRSPAKPNSRPNRPFGAYAIDARKARHQCSRQQDASAG
jgi:hypothetical protein